MPFPLAIVAIAESTSTSVASSSARFTIWRTSARSISRSRASERRAASSLSRAPASRRFVPPLAELPLHRPDQLPPLGDEHDLAADLRRDAVDDAFLGGGRGHRERPGQQ